MGSIGSNARAIARVIREAGKWYAYDNMPSMAAALAFHFLLSLAPLLVIIVGTFHMILGTDAAGRQIITQVEQSLGPKASQAVQLVLDSTGSGPGALAVGGGTIILLIIFSAGVFSHLIHALNVIWKVGVPGRSGVKRSLIRMIRGHLLAWVMIVCVGLYLYLSLLAGAIEIIPDRFISGGEHPFAGFWPHIPQIVAPVVLFLLFMVLFKILPDKAIAWRDVWCGALVTAAIFTVSNKLIVHYLQWTIFSSFYGAAGSFIIVLLWVYWTAMVFLFGAELTRVCAERTGGYAAARPPFPPVEDEG